MKRIAAWLLAVSLILATFLTLTACGDESEGNGTSQKDDRVLPCKECDEGEYFSTVTKRATAFDGGILTYTCDKCSDSYNKSTDATGEMSILVIGDSSSSTALTYLDEVLNAHGVERALIATMNCNYSTGAAIDDHWNNIQLSKRTYTLTISENGTTSEIKYSQTFSDCLAFGEWDYIVIQQSIPKIGIASDYSNIDYLVNYIEDTKPNADASLLWNMGWAYNKNSSHAGFENYEFDQSAMYAGIINNLTTFIEVNDKIDAILPVGAAIQNLRATFLDGSVTGVSGIQLETSIGAYVTAVVWGSYILEENAEGIGLTVDSESVSDYYSILNPAIDFAIADPYEIKAPKLKSIKILSFGNSYSNDARTYLYKIFKSAGYQEIILGTVMDGGCDINHHWWNIDDTLEDYHPASQYEGMTGVEGTAGCSISFNGKSVSVSGDTLKQRYINLIEAYDWDYVTIQHGPNTVEKLDTYSYLPNLLEFIEEHLTSEETEFIYHMVWKYNDSQSSAFQRTSYQYDNIIDITRNTVLVNEQFTGVIPAVTFRQNMTSSFLNDVDISRDYGHMGLTLGRYALGLLWYCYLTGGSVDDVSYIPSPDEVSDQEWAVAKQDYGHVHREITEADMLVVREAIENALEKPYEITQSIYTTAP